MSGDAEGLDELLAQMQRLQSDLADAERASASSRVTGSAGGGAVRIVLSGEFSFDEVHLQASILEQGDVSLVEDLVLAACRDAVGQLLALRNQAMGDAVGHTLGSLFGSEPGGFDLGLDLSQLTGGLAIGGDDSEDEEDDEEGGAEDDDLDEPTE